MRRKIIVAAFAVAAIAVCTCVSLAFFSAEDKVTNVITAGNVKIALQEMMLAEDGETLVPFKDAYGVMPGTDISKIVTVKNTGDNPAYVRVKVDSIINVADKEKDEALSEQFDAYISYDINTTNWTYKDDGYYYYNTSLAAGAQTEPLFTTVMFSRLMPNEFQNTSAEINITAYATQTAHNGTNVFDAAGWPN